MLCHAECVGDLIDQATPRTYVCDVIWSWEVGDGLEDIIAWLYCVWCDFESRELDCVSTKCEFFGVLDDAISTAEFEPFSCLEKALLQGIFPQPL